MKKIFLYFIYSAPHLTFTKLLECHIQLQSNLNLSARPVRTQTRTLFNTSTYRRLCQIRTTTAHMEREHCVTIKLEVV